jgi:hypothetical protein
VIIVPEYLSTASVCRRRLPIFAFAVIAILPSYGIAGDDLRDKMGVYVTPFSENDPRFAVGYSEAVNVLRGSASTVWILESWHDIETLKGQYDWQGLDEKVNAAHDAGFSVGLRIQLILCGNDEHKNFVAESRIPAFYSQGMGTPEFASQAATFYGQVAQRYRDKVKYISIGNSVNKYFEQYPEQWEGFKRSYNDIVDAIHRANPASLVVSDITYGEEFYTHQGAMKKYVDFFSQSNDDLIGVVFYFISDEFYGDFSNFNIATLRNVLNGLHALAPNKKLYILETASFSTHPLTGGDISAVQARYVRMLLTTAKETDYLAGVCWWLLYDAKDLRNVPWDLRATFGLFDSSGHSKQAWDVWKSFYAGDIAH